MELRNRCGELDDACVLVARFASILVNRRQRGPGQEELDQWTADAEASRPSELRGFAIGLRKDRDAVMAGLTLRWNSGPVECHVATSTGSR